MVVIRSLNFRDQKPRISSTERPADKAPVKIPASPLLIDLIGFAPKLVPSVAFLLWCQIYSFCSAKCHSHGRKCRYGL